MSEALLNTLVWTTYKCKAELSMNLSNIQYSDFSKARELEFFTINIAWWHFQLMAWMLHNSEVLLDCILRSVLKLKMVPCDSHCSRQRSVGPLCSHRQQWRS